MCDYYAFACRFQCLPETHHFPLTRFSIMQHTFGITNDRNPSCYEHIVNYSQTFFFISILTCPWPPRKGFLLQKKKPSPQILYHSHLMLQCEYFLIILICSLLNSSNPHHRQRSDLRFSGWILLKKCSQDRKSVV